MIATVSKKKYSVLFSVAILEKAATVAALVDRRSVYEVYGLFFPKVPVPMWTLFDNSFQAC